ncbi:endolytic transglycosylase MltG [Dehalobacter sp. DCM]|uniref:endolytic transglycosylase MltG n=1 Tax=Dehalobacter sp. DCM TaxID=2907827 RepID=UPI0030820633|nr:endolytic transglycosylase MltG [Dehalobacter sp. DCM]
MSKRYRRKSSSRKINRAFGIIIVILFVAIAASAWWTTNLRAVSKTQEKQVFVLEYGMTASDVATELKNMDLIRNANVFELLCKSKKADAKLMAGMYYLSPSMSSKEILNVLIAGPEPEVVRVTIPEGYTTGQIVAALAKNGLGTEKELYAAIQSFNADDYSFLEGTPTGETHLEGFLFPDTYFFDKKATARDTIDRFLLRFEQELTDETTNRLKEVNMSIYEWVIKASIVEREAVKAEERPLIAGVFENRLRTNMPLESCATIQYILGEVKPVLTIEDTKIDSPYNTYQHIGLPPGPIANPGDASLQAALYPKETDYFFFVAKNDGSHAFSVTYQEHLRNVNIYQ